MTTNDQRRLALAAELNYTSNRLASLSQRVRDAGDPAGAFELGHLVGTVRNIADGLEYDEDDNRLREG